MEQLLRELISVNREMLSELRLLRQALCQEAQEPRPSEPTFGEQEASAPKSPPPRYTPQDLEDIRGSLMEGLKQRNKEKSNAFSEFEKRHKNW